MSQGSGTPLPLQSGSQTSGTPSPLQSGWHSSGRPFSSQSWLRPAPVAVAVGDGEAEPGQEVDQPLLVGLVDHVVAVQVDRVLLPRAVVVEIDHGVAVHVAGDDRLPQGRENAGTADETAGVRGDDRDLAGVVDGVALASAERPVGELRRDQVGQRQRAERIDVHGRPGHVPHGVAGVVDVPRRDLRRRVGGPPELLPAELLGVADREARALAAGNRIAGEIVVVVHRHDRGAAEHPRREGDGLEGVDVERGRGEPDDETVLVDGRRHVRSAERRQVQDAAGRVEPDGGAEARKVEDGGADDVTAVVDGGGDAAGVSGQVAQQLHVVAALAVRDPGDPVAELRVRARPGRPHDDAGVVDVLGPAAGVAVGQGQQLVGMARAGHEPAQLAADDVPPDHLAACVHAGDEGGIPQVLQRVLGRPRRCRRGERGDRGQERKQVADARLHHGLLRFTAVRFVGVHAASPLASSNGSVWN
jgi:hypothetical protein